MRICGDPNPSPSLVFPNHFYPTSKSKTGFADTTKQVGPEFFAVALLEHFKIEWRGPRKKEHVLEVAIIVALQLTERDIVGIHYEQMDIFEDIFKDRSKPFLVVIRDLHNADEVQVDTMLPR